MWKKDSHLVAILIFLDSFVPTIDRGARFNKPVVDILQQTKD